MATAIIRVFHEHTGPQKVLFEAFGFDLPEPVWAICHPNRAMFEVAEGRHEGARGCEACLSGSVGPVVRDLERIAILETGEHRICAPREPVVEQHIAFFELRLVPDAVRDGIGCAVGALYPDQQVLLLSRLQEFGLPETDQEQAASVGERCAAILAKLSAGLISRRWDDARKPHGYGHWGPLSPGWCRAVGEWCYEQGQCLWEFGPDCPKYIG